MEGPAKKRGCPIPNRVPIQGIRSGFPSERILIAITHESGARCVFVASPTMPSVLRRSPAEQMNRRVIEVSGSRYFDCASRPFLVQRRLDLRYGLVEDRPNV